MTQSHKCPSFSVGIPARCPVCGTENSRPPSGQTPSADSYWVFILDRYNGGPASSTLYDGPDAADSAHAAADRWNADNGQSALAVVVGRRS